MRKEDADRIKDPVDSQRRVNGTERKELPPENNVGVGQERRERARTRIAQGVEVQGRRKPAVGKAGKELEDIFKHRRGQGYMQQKAPDDRHCERGRQDGGTDQLCSRQRTDNLCGTKRFHAITIFICPRPQRPRGRTAAR
jgi:hypothetical protein